MTEKLPEEQRTNGYPSKRVYSRPVITKYVQEHPGEMIWLENLQELAPGASANGIRNTMKNLEAEGKVQVSVRGHAWFILARPVPPAAPQVQSPQVQSPQVQISSTPPESTAEVDWDTTQSVPGPKARGGKLFEQVGVTRDGTVILECEDGRLFQAFPLVSPTE